MKEEAASPEVDVESAGEAEAVEHIASVAVWDGPSPAIRGEPVTIKVGVACACGCDLSGGRVILRDEAGALIVSAAADSVWVDSGGLYGAELTFPGPGELGVAAYTAAGDLSAIEPPHADAMAPFTLRVEPKPEHRVVVRARFTETGEAIANAEICLGRYMAHTDASGEVRFDLPPGLYECTLRKFGFSLQPTTIDVSEDLTLDLDVGRGDTREDIERLLSAMEDHPWG